MPKLEILPLGGMGQIGANCISFKSPQISFLIDCGILFPNEDLFNINSLVPDFSKIDTPRFVFITHGHEDHIGGIATLLSFFPKLLIYAPPLAARLIKEKIDSIFHSQIIIYNDSSVITCEDLVIAPIRVNHSIPDTFGLLISHEETDQCIFYVSDFRVDVNAPKDRCFDFEKLTRLSKPFKKRILIPDSTNILSSHNKTPDEISVRAELDKIFHHVSGRIFLTLFPSNIERVQTVIDLCEKYQYKIHLLGHAVKKMFDIAKDCNLLSCPDRIILDRPSNIKNMCVLISGCQGEFRSSLRSLVMGDSSILSPKKSDTFIYSAKIIPGNDKKVLAILNRLIENEVEVYLPEEHGIHTSGHAGRDDIELVVKNFSPHLVIPCHGESLFLHRHATYIREKLGLPSQVLLNGSRFISSLNEWHFKHGDPPELLFIGNHGRVIEKASINPRRKVSQSGILLLSLFRSHLSSFQSDFQLIGFPHQAAFDKEKVDNIIQQLILKNSNLKRDDLIDYATGAIKNHFRKAFGIAPEVVITVFGF